MLSILLSMHTLVSFNCLSMVRFKTKSLVRRSFRDRSVYKYL